MQSVKILITALILGLSGLIVTSNAQTFVAMRVNISGTNYGIFLPETAVSSITGTYQSSLSGNLFQEFIQGPSPPNSSGFTYVGATGNLTFNLANFGAGLTFNPSVFLTTFQFDVTTSLSGIATPIQNLSTGAFTLTPMVIGQPSPVFMDTLYFDDSLPPHYPSYPTNLTLENSEEFAYLKWQDPTTTVDGSPLTSLSKIVIFKGQNAIDTVSVGIENYVDFNTHLYFGIKYTLKAINSANEVGPPSFPIKKYFEGETYFHEPFENSQNWTFSGTDSTVGWGIDGSPNEAGNQKIPFSGSKCLNYNNGTFISSKSGTDSAFATFNQTIDLTNIQNPFLNFKLLSKIYASSAIVTVQVSDNNFANILQSANYQSGTSDWFDVKLPLYSSSQNIKVRFRYFDDSPSYNFLNGIFVDDLKIKGQKPKSVPTVFFEPFETTQTSASPFNLTVQVYDTVSVPTVDLHWRSSPSNPFTVLPMLNLASNEFTAQIPAQSVGTEIEYFISMTNSNSITNTSPENAPAELHSFIFGNGIPPQNFTATSNLDSTVQLNWEIADTTNYFYSAFKIYRSTNPNDLVYPIGQQFLVSQFPAIFPNEFWDANLNNGTTYYYKVTSIFTDSSGTISESYPTEIVSAIPEDVSPPSEPTNLVPQKLTLGQTKLTWNDPTTDSNGNSLNDFEKVKIYRSETQNGFYKPLATVLAGVEQFYDLDTLMTEKFYAITALDEKANESRTPAFTSVDFPATYGGSDNFGYIWLSSQNGLIPFEFENISTFGNSLGIYGSSIWSSVNLPWSFPFYQNSYSYVLVSANGYVTFGNDGNYTPTAIPSPNPPNNFIAPFWKDLKIENGVSEIFTHFDSTDNKFIIQWNKALSSLSETNTFQVILSPNGEINFNYANIDENLTGVTAGIEDSNGTDGLETSFLGSLVQDNFSMKFLKDVKPVIVPVQTQNTSNFQKPHKVFAHISSPVPLLAPILFLQWKTNNSPNFNTVPLNLVSGQLYKAEIPPQPNGTLVQYYFSAASSFGTTTSPENAPTNLHQFTVSSDLPPSNLNAESNHDKKVLLSWFYPIVFNFSPQPAKSEKLKEFSLTKSDFKKISSKKQLLAKISSGNLPLTIDSLNLETFRIYRSTNPIDLSQPDSTFLIHETSNAFVLDYFDTDSVLTNETEYFYTITSVFTDSTNGSTVESLPSEIVSAIPKDLVPPANPTNFSSSLVPPTNQIVLNWNNPTTDADGFPLNDFSHLNLYKKDPGKTLKPLGTFPLGVQTFLDQNPVNGNNFYLFSTVDTKGNESDFVEFVVTDTTFYSEETEGYVWVSSETGMFQESFTDISNLSTASALGIYGNDEEEAFSLFWNFPLFGQNENYIRISTRGFVTFGNSTLGAERTFLPNSALPNNLIAPLWADFEVRSGIGEVYYFEDLVVGKAIIQWTNVNVVGDTTDFNTFQLEFHQDGKFFFHYGQLTTATSIPSTIGFENPSGTKGLLVGYESEFLKSNTSYIFTKNYFPKINSLTNISETDEFDKNLLIQADIVPTDLIFPKHELHWKFTTDTNYNILPLVLGTNFIPAPNQFGVEIEYFVSVTDSVFSFANSYFPFNSATNSVAPYKFKVRLIPPGNLIAQSNINSAIPLSWEESGLSSLIYDDGTSEFASSPTGFAGLNAPSKTTFTTVFEVTSQSNSPPLELNSAQLYFVDVTYPLSDFKVKVFDFDTTTNLPGNVLTETQILNQSGLSGEFLEIDFTAPISGVGIPIGKKFCVGIEQLNTNPIGLGGDTTFTSPYEFKPNTFFVKSGTNGAWNPIEVLPEYGQVIPMIRAVLGTPNTVIAPIQKQKKFVKSKAQTQKNKTKLSTQKSEKAPSEINSFPTWQLLDYKLYKMFGIASSAEEVVTNGNLIFTDTTKAFVDNSVLNPNSYSYAVTATYDVNGSFLESESGNFAVAIPDGTPQISFSDLDFGIAQINDSLFANLKIENSGTAPLEILGMSFSNPNAFGFQNLSLPFTILAKDSSEVELFCFSQSPANFDEKVYIFSNSPANYDTVNIFAEIVLSALENFNEIPKVFSLEQNFPNPFNPITTIKFGIPKESFVKLTIFNVLGQQVKTLVRENLAPSFYSFQWDGTNDFGKLVSSGVYFYKIETGDFKQTKKLLFLK